MKGLQSTLPRDHTRQIRGQHLGHVISVDKSEASICIIVEALHLAAPAVGLPEELERRLELGLEGHRLGLGHLRSLARLVQLPEH